MIWKTRQRLAFNGKRLIHPSTSVSFCRYSTRMGGYLAGFEPSDLARWKVQIWYRPMRMDGKNSLFVYIFFEIAVRVLDI